MTEAAQSEAPQHTESETPEKDPVRTWTLRLLVVALVLLVFYLVSDRITPLSTQARVHALVVPIAAEVSGRVTEVLVSNDQVVSAGDVLFRIDPTQYALAVANAEASLQSAREAVGASVAAVASAAAGVGSAQARLESSEQDAVRLRRIKAQDPGALSDRRIESSEASLKVAQHQVIAAEANLEQARQKLGAEGEENAQVQQARAALEQAQVNLGYADVRAPTNGLVTDVRLDRGNFASAGAPQLTFIAAEDVWVQADFTENNLGLVDRGDSLELQFDVYPGRVFEGSVRQLGYGVAIDSAPLGSLPTIENDRQWLRDSQRFPVMIDFEMAAADRARLRVGAQVSVIIYASDNWLFNSLGALIMRVSSFLSYAY
jgi:multidrug resistance efflux pump